MDRTNAYILHFLYYVHFSKTLGGIFQKPGWTPNPGWDFPKAWVEFSASSPSWGGGRSCNATEPERKPNFI